jgi:hypothetical protein
VLGASSDYMRHDSQIEMANDLENKAEEEMFCAYTSAMNQNGIFLTARVVLP